MKTLYLKSPVGDLTLFADDDGIVALSWGHGMNAPTMSTVPILNQAAHMLKHYFKTGQENFSILKLNPTGTPFQRRAWKSLQHIQIGQTKSYGQLAKTLNSGPRAVGGACAANPVPILIPCHRVLAADGKVGNYSGGNGPDTKQFLLHLEGYSF